MRNYYALSEGFMKCMLLHVPMSLTVKQVKFNVKSVQNTKFLSYSWIRRLWD